MATRSRIGIQIEGGIVSAYHHWDGYPEWLGVTLNQNFNDEDQYIILSVAKIRLQNYLNQLLNT